jgi:hypothetical protein
MKRKNVIVLLAIVTAISFLYLNSFFVQAKNEDIKFSDDIVDYTTHTDKVCCDKLAGRFEDILKSQTGVREVKLENKPDAAGIMTVTVRYSKSEASEDIIGDYIKSAETEIISLRGCSSGEKKSCGESDKETDCSTKCGKKSGQEKKGCNK